MKYYLHKIQTPVGELSLVASDASLLAVLWEADDPQRVPLSGECSEKPSPILKETERQLMEYFAGERHIFDLPIRFNGTDFQNSVWKALQTIPYGCTASYGGIAQSIGSPKASRAVGAANGKNPLSIIVPCHRVVGSDGSLTGFAGGLKIKERLLELENKTKKWRTDAVAGLSG
jgi:methylated-DNA-[protein]-cysteine S-methyltransferase